MPQPSDVITGRAAGGRAARGSAATARPRAVVAALAAAVTIAAATLSGWATAPVAAQVVPTLSISPASVSPDRPSTVTVTGRNYLVPPHAPGANVSGGVYVLFGWVAPGVSWGPSARNATNSNGQFGVTYTYPGEGGTGETRDDGSGTNRFVSFTAGGVSGNSTAFHMDDAGNWSTTLTILGPVYEWFDPITGQRAVVDCRVVQCGVYTFGAHGRASATNERFAPVSFARTSTPTTAAPRPATPTTVRPAGGGVATPTPTPAPTAVPRAPASGTARVAGATTTILGPAPTDGAAAAETTTTAPEAATADVPPEAATTTTTATTSTDRSPNRATGSRDERAESVVVDGGGGAPTGWIALGGGSVIVAGALSLWTVRRRRAH